MNVEKEKIFELKNPFGIVNGSLIHIKDTEKGMDVYCPICNEKLILRDGNKMVKHLSHKINKSDECSNESVIHKLTKDYIYQELKNLNIKEHKIKINSNGKFRLSEYENLNIKHKFKEYRNLSPKYIPDIFLILEGNYKICLEICYKNPKDPEYLKELLCTLPIDIVMEIPVNDEDLIEFKIDEILSRGKIIYNRLEPDLVTAEEKIRNIVDKYNEVVANKKTPKYKRKEEKIYFKNEVIRLNQQIEEMEEAIKLKNKEIAKLRQHNGYYKDFKRCVRAIRTLYKEIYPDKNLSLSANADECSDVVIEIANHYDFMNKKIKILMNGIYNIYEVLGKKDDFNKVRHYENNAIYSQRITKIEDNIDKIVRDIRNNEHQKQIKKYKEENKDIKEKLINYNVKINQLEYDLRESSMYKIQLDIKNKEIERLNSIIDELENVGCQIKLM